jgi:uncharacterized integral membrane protein
MGMVLMPVRRSDETRSNTAMRAYGAVYKGAGINIMNLQLALIITSMLLLVIVITAIQNSMPLDFKFFTWNFQISITALILSKGPCRNCFAIAQN